MQMQVGKAAELLAPLGLNRKRLERWIDDGIIRPRRKGRGRGSLRLFDDRAFLDAYLAASLFNAGWPSRKTSSLLRHLRQRYNTWLTSSVGTVIVRFEPRRSPGTVPDPSQLVSLYFDLTPLRIWLTRLNAQGGTLQQIERGRPVRNWREEFRAALTALSREMYEKQITEQDIDSAIASVRARRGEQQEAPADVVTVPAP